MLTEAQVVLVQAQEDVEDTVLQVQLEDQKDKMETLLQQLQALEAGVVEDLEVQTLAMLPQEAQAVMDIKEE
jgi:hypothetical protein